jgi:hypothetical protein
MDRNLILYKLQKYQNKLENGTGDLNMYNAKIEFYKDLLGGEPTPWKNFKKLPNKVSNKLDKYRESTLGTKGKGRNCNNIENYHTIYEYTTQISDKIDKKDIKDTINIVELYTNISKIKEKYYNQLYCNTTPQLQDVNKVYIKLVTVYINILKVVTKQIPEALQIDNQQMKTKVLINLKFILKNILNRPARILVSEREMSSTPPTTQIELQEQRKLGMAQKVGNSEKSQYVNQFQEQRKLGMAQKVGNYEKSQYVNQFQKPLKDTTNKEIIRRIATNLRSLLLVIDNNIQKVKYKKFFIQQYTFYKKTLNYIIDNLVDLHNNVHNNDGIYVNLNTPNPSNFVSVPDEEDYLPRSVSDIVASINNRQYINLMTPVSVSPQQLAERYNRGYKDEEKYDKMHKEKKVVYKSGSGPSQERKQEELPPYASHNKLPKTSATEDAPGYVSMTTPPTNSATEDASGYVSLTSPNVPPPKPLLPPQ